MLRFAAVLVFSCILNVSQFNLILGRELNSNVGSNGGKEEFDLIVRRAPHEVTTIDCNIGIRGTVILEAQKADGEETSNTTFPLKVENRYQFDERFLSERKAKLIRCYQTAQSNINIGKGNRTNTLESENGLVIFHRARQDRGTKNWTITTSGRPLEESQYDMLAIPFNTVIVDRLFSRRNVSKGFAWQPEDQLLAEAVLIDAVDVNHVEIKVLDHFQGKAELFIAGHTEGVIDGAITKIAINGSATFDTRIGRLTEYRIRMNEDRSPSQAAPGYKAIIEMETKISPSTHPGRLSDSVISPLRDSRVDNTLLFEAKSGHFSMKHDRDWKIVSDQGQSIALRLISDGDPIAQCTVFELPNLAAGQPLKVANFKKLVTEMITDESIGIDKIQEAYTKDDNHVLRVSAHGKQESVELRWTYYHIANKQGQRLLFVFTMEDALADDVGLADQYLVESVSFKSREKSTDVASGQRANIK